MPGTVIGTTLNDWGNELLGLAEPARGRHADALGALFEGQLTDLLCNFLRPTHLNDRLWITPQVETDGRVTRPGLHCSNIPSNSIERRRFNSRRARSISTNNPDFLFHIGNPTNNRFRNPDSYLIGDIKFRVATAHRQMNGNSQQWQAISQHASTYQLLPFASYITFQDTGSDAQKSRRIREMQDIALRNQVVLFVVSLFD